MKKLENELERGNSNKPHALSTKLLPELNGHGGTESAFSSFSHTRSKHRLSNNIQSASETMFKRQKQIEYKNALDMQKLVQQEYKQNGNMTHAEKMLNR